MYKTLGILFLVAEIIVICVFVFGTALMYKRHKILVSKKNLWYLIPSFLLIYLLGLTARFYGGAPVDFFVCFDLVNTTLDVFGFQIDDYIVEICKNGIFYADFVIAYVLAVITAVTGVLGFFGLRLHNSYIKCKAYHKGCDLVLGDSESSLLYLKVNPGSVMIAPKITGKRYVELLKSGFTVDRKELNSVKLAKRVKKNDFDLIVFRDRGYPYTKIIDEFSALRKNGGRVDLHFEATLDETKIVRRKFIEKAGAEIEPHIRCFSKYELIARKFVADYPITKYIPREFYNDNFSIKNNKKINVVFIGFGKVNYQLFRMFAMQFQFASEKKGRLISKPVDYYIYDCQESALSNEFRSRIEYEFDEIFSDCDFPKPEKICEMHVENVDINSCDVKRKFRSLVDKNSYTYFIVSLDDDLKDAAYAQTIRRLFNDDYNYKIFVRAKNKNGETLNVSTDSVVYFGDDISFYTHDNIVNDALSETAQRLNLLYEMTKKESQDKESKQPKCADRQAIIDKGADGQATSEGNKAAKQKQSAELNDYLKNPDNRKYMLDLWSNLKMIDQSSNLYRALNIPFKLAMLGFEMVESGGKITEKEFFNRYAKADSAEESKKKYTDYSVYFKTEPCNVFAYIEHARWNALYILYDFKQMSKSEMKVEEKVENGKSIREVCHKDKDKMRHGCLTSYYGLDDLIKFKFELLYGKTEANNVSNTDARLLELSDIYKYDYLDLENLYSYILTMGYTVADRLTET